MTSDLTDLTLFIVVNDKNEMFTDSRFVAIHYHKQHKNVLRSIDRMLKSKVPEIAEHARLNFEPVDFIDKNGSRRPMYRMTREGFAELAMGFTGEASRLLRIRFLNAFKQVAKRLADALVDTEQSKADLDRSVTEQLFALERREGKSEAKGKIGSKLMHERRKEKPEFDEQRAALMDLAQPKLFGAH